MRTGTFIRAAISALVLAAGLRVAARPTGPVPALGRFLDPWNGVWSVSAGRAPAELEEVELVNLSAPVRVGYDVRGVPHIFASASEDAARALGYVVARDRLFQLELRWRTAAGRLSEVLGEEALEFDRAMRGLGLAWSAERDFEALDRSSPAMREIAAYAEGVNAWIGEMGRRDLPFEFHLLGATPTRFEPVYSLYLLRLMGWDLTYPVSIDLTRLRLMALVGEAAANALAPVHSPIQEPIQPTGQNAPRFDFAPIPPPGQPDSAALAGLTAFESTLGHLARSEPGVSEPTLLGSNNWAVAPSRTAAGYALLAGDPHLDLTLPSIWYEAHLVVPGELDVYGATIPSVPLVILGFNRDVAWSFTNTGADVIDYYREELDSPDRPTRYKLDGEWRTLESRIEEYRGSDGRRLALDTLYFTHRGPLVNGSGHSLSMRWTVLEGSTENEVLRRVARAANVEEWLSAAEQFTAPAQNMIVADRDGAIAIRSTGRFPVQPNGNGLILRDGTMSASDWRGFWQLERYPSAIDPRQGYLASANQQPIDPTVDSTYLGADWPSPWRAMRINALLRADSSLTPDAMRRFQTDPGNARADFFVPYFLEAARTSEAAGEATRAVQAATLLDDWDRRYTKENERAVLFEYAMSELVDRTWDELVRTGDSAVGEGEVPAGRRIFTPSSAVLASLLQQPQSPWWDDRRTPEIREDRDAVLVASLATALERAERELGVVDDGGWRWEKVRHANIYHLLQIPAFSALDLPVQGGPGNLNPSSGRGTAGASWRMVVELGPQLRAWTIYPGGQSGNPFNPRYAERIRPWVDGDLEAVLFPRSLSDLETGQLAGRLDLYPEREQ